MAVVIRDAGQSDADPGRQPASGLVANNDFLTSNLGSGQIADLVQGGMGFIQPNDKPALDCTKR